MSTQRFPRFVPACLVALMLTAFAPAVPILLAPAAADDAPTATEEALDARHAPEAVDDAASAYDVDDWFLLSTPRHEDGRYSAFAFRIPNGSVHPHPQAPDFPTMRFELVTVADAFAPGEDWSLFAFHEDAGEARLVFAILGPTLDHEDLSTTPATHSTQPPNAGGTLIPYTWPSLEVGDDLYFVLVGHGDPDDDMAFAFRLAPPDPAYVPASDFDAFVATEPDPPVVPAREGAGTGAYVGYYNERLDPSGERRRVVSEAVHHDQDVMGAPGVDTARVVSTTVHSDAGSGTGWALAYAEHFAWSEASHWTLDVAAQGESARSNGPSVNDPLGASGALAQRAAGRARALFMADGDGESHVRLTLQGAEVDLGVATAVQHHRLSTPLADLIGVPSATWTDISRGGGDGLPWVGPLPS